LQHAWLVHETVWPLQQSLRVLHEPPFALHDDGGVHVPSVQRRPAQHACVVQSAPTALHFEPGESAFASRGDVGVPASSTGAEPSSSPEPVMSFALGSVLASEPATMVVVELHAHPRAANTREQGKRRASLRFMAVSFGRSKAGYGS
jgi:hypothetical protein